MNSSSLSREGKDWIARLEAQERSRHRHQQPQGALQQGLRLLPGDLQGQPAPGAAALPPQADPGERRALHHRGPQRLRVPGPGGRRGPASNGRRSFSRTCGSAWARRSPVSSRWPGPWQSWTSWPALAGTGGPAPLLPPPDDPRAPADHHRAAATRSSSGCCRPAPLSPTT